MKSIFLFIHILFAIALMTLILLQNSKGGLGAAFGGGEMYRSKRGAERIIFSATIVFSVLFLITSVVNLLLR